MEAILLIYAKVSTLIRFHIIKHLASCPQHTGLSFNHSLLYSRIDFTRMVICRNSPLFEPIFIMYYPDKK